MIERDVINAKFDILQRDLAFAKELGRVKPAEFGFKEEQAAKYTLLEIAEACIDIASHIVAARGFRRAEEYSELFQILREEGVISPALGDRLSAMAKMRNLLIHRYGEVDNRRLLSILGTRMGDVEQFMSHIAAFISKKPRS
ncbi:MAG: DUF86 domain-containing protein [Candidatus Aenigmarchaeota archaeon]|nr:DUF86 domain-containing protein [Candidatus Aenigmarchaeota archaeon]